PSHVRGKVAAQETQHTELAPLAHVLLLVTHQPAVVRRAPTHDDERPERDGIGAGRNGTALPDAHALVQPSREPLAIGRRPRGVGRPRHLPRPDGRLRSRPVPAGPRTPAPRAPEAPR